MKHCILAGAVALMAMPAQATTLTDIFDSFFVVGDSLSDNSNTAAMVGAINAQQTDPIEFPDPSPLQQPGVSSDGFTWAKSFTDAFAAVPGKTTANLSFGSARAREDMTGPPDLAAQLSPAPSFSTTFLEVEDKFGAKFDLTGTVPKYSDGGGGLLSRLGDGSGRELVTFFIGGNDFRDAFAATDPITQQAILGAAFQSIQTNMFTALGAGVQDFVLMNIPDFTALPGLNLLPETDPTRLLLNATVSQFNSNLALLAEGLRSNPFVNVTEVDVFGLLRDDEKLGLFGPDFDTVNACLAVNAVTPLQSCEGFLFWDSIHPTKQGHQLLEMATLEALGKTYPQLVPLPAPALMLLSALGGLAVMRRRRKAA